MTTAARPRLSVYGAGKLGQTLARLWCDAGLVEVGQVICRSQASAKAAVAFIGDGAAETPTTPAASADLWLLSCPDQQIENAGRWLTNCAMPHGGVIFHCAGSLSHQCIPALPNGARASVHPVHAFTKPSHDANTLQGVACVAEGDGAALKRLKPLFNALGCQWIPLLAAEQNADNIAATSTETTDSGHRKALYHAATVSASNHLVALVDHAVRLAEHAGLSNAAARAVLAPLARKNLENALREPAAEVLTGPISRGDAVTLAHHFAAMSTQSVAGEDQQLYRQLARATLAIAKQQLAGDSSKLAHVEALMQSDGASQPHKD